MCVGGTVLLPLGLSPSSAFPPSPPTCPPESGVQELAVPPGIGHPLEEGKRGGGLGMPQGGGRGHGPELGSLREGRVCGLLVPIPPREASS